MIVWYCLMPDIQNKLRILMPKSWRPPPDDGRVIEAPLERSEELAAIMQKVPGNYRGED